MKILAIETSTKYLGLAVVGEDEIIVEHTALLEREISKFLAPEIKEILKETGLSLQDIDGIAVSVGPGSFTGLRIGVTAAKGLAIFTKKPLVGVPTLDALAQNLSHFQGKICAIVDAKKNMVYTAVYDSKGAALSRRSKPACRRGRPAVEPIEDVLKRAKGKTLFLGDGIDLYRREILKHKGKDALFASKRLWYPRASSVGFLGLERLKRGKSDDPYELVPMYVHPKTCTIRKVT